MSQMSKQEVTQEIIRQARAKDIIMMDGLIILIL
jgi:hypothetical protein